MTVATRVRLGSMGDRLADDLRERIVRGQLTRGTRLPEEAIAAEYDVSRGPVRDALKLLASEQLIDIGRGGATVRGVGVDEVRELYALRRALEPLAVQAALRAGDHDWADAGAELDGMARAADESRWAEYADHDLRFHSAIYARSGNSRLQAVWERYRPTFAVMIRITVAQDVDLHPSAVDHADLLEALRRGDEEAALAVLLPHLDGARDRMLTALGEQDR